MHLYLIIVALVILLIVGLTLKDTAEGRLSPKTLLTAAAIIALLIVNYYIWFKI